MAPSPTADAPHSEGIEMKITIAGYGSVGSYVAALFGDLQPTLYDPPLGLGTAHDLRDADFVIVCVPTPQLPSGACDTSIVEEVVRLADPRAAIVCHSTVAIGTTERLIAETGKPIVFVPEYAGEADAHPLRDPRNRRFLIYGGHEPAASEVQALYERAYGPGLRHFRVPPRVAEVVKYMENAFLATKVAFCNEFFDLCAAVGVDYDWARLLWLQDDRINPSHTRVTAERGYGGQCLPKDIAAVSASARDLGTPLAILEAVQEANAWHRTRAAGAAATELAAMAGVAGR